MLLCIFFTNPCDNSIITKTRNMNPNSTTPKSCNKTFGLLLLCTCNSPEFILAGFLRDSLIRHNRTNGARVRVQWRTQKLFVRGADEWFKHIFKWCGQIFYLKNTLNFFFKGVRPPTQDYT
ncbi:hypothetical protein HanIR_Chr01g0029431 [Helianthus annuus]|nr:hypothetical protein HanIR_Chr01g0029431 [Helianthus annuus]